jgi:hypothetical protein
MNLTPQDLKVITMKGPKGHVPDGMKVATISGPNVLNPLPACPVLAIGSFILWPMSYIDNRVSFGMVMYNPRWKAGAQVEKRGARYVYKITVDGSGSVTFWGQGDQKVTLTLAEICQLMCT